MLWAGGGLSFGTSQNKIAITRYIHNIYTHTLYVIPVSGIDKKNRQITFLDILKFEFICFLFVFYSSAGLNLNLPQEQTHAIGLFKYILRTEGPRGLYRGIVPNFCKVAPAVSISYYVYERTRHSLGIEMV